MFYRDKLLDKRRRFRWLLAYVVVIRTDKSSMADVRFI